MNKTVLAYGIVALIVIAAFFTMWSGRNDSDTLPEKEPDQAQQEIETPTPISINEEANIELTTEERAALKADAIEVLGNDAKKDELRNVRSSDSMEAINADISATDMNGIGSY